MHINPLNALLGGLVVALIIGFGREILDAARVRWMLSRAGKAEFNLRFLISRYWITTRSRWYVFRLRMSQRWYRLRVSIWCWRSKTTRGLPYPVWNPPKGPYERNNKP